MIKKFEEFINESVEITTKVNLDENFELLVALRDFDERKNYNIEIVDKNFEIDQNEKNDHIPATIYVMPDDVVEVRTIDNNKYLYGKVVDLNGEMVRKDELHRHNWEIIIRLHKKDVE